MYETKSSGPKRIDESKIQRLQKQAASMKNDRALFEAEWKSIEEFVMPGVCEWSRSESKQPPKTPDKIIDDTPVDCIEVLQAGLTSHVTNPARKWVDPTLQDKTMAREEVNREWLSHVQEQMLEGHRSSNLYSVLPQAYGICAAYGAILFEEDSEDSFRFYSLPVGSYWISQNARGVVDCVYREIEMTVRQVFERFGYDGMSEEVQRKFDDKSYDEPVAICHMVYPNEKHDPKSPFAKHFKYASCYWEEKRTDGVFLSESGFRTFPILVGRWSVRGRAAWGIGLGRRLLPLSRALQMYERKVAQAVSKEVSPPLQAPTSMAGMEISTAPDAINYVDEIAGRNGIRSLYERGTFQMQNVEAKMAQLRAQMKRVTFYDLFLLMTQETRSNVTAEEIRARLDEKILAIGPVLERLVDDILDPLFARALDILMDQGRINEPPPEIVGMPMAVEYSGALAQGQKLLGLAPIDRFLAAADRLGQRDPRAYDTLNAEATLREYADLLSVPNRILNSRQQVAAIQEQRAKAAQSQAANESLAQGAQAAKMLSETDTTAGALSDLIQMQTGL